MNGSILYIEDEQFTEFDASVFHDLRIDKVLQNINREGSAFLQTMYLRKPGRLEDVLFRLSCMEDLERPQVREIIIEFVAQYERYRDELANSVKLPQRQTKQKWFLDAAVRYCESMLALKTNLAQAGVKSEALRRLLRCLESHTETEEFTALHADAGRCADRLHAIRYTVEVTLNQNKIRVAADLAERQDADDLFQTIARKFRQYDLNVGATVVPFPGVTMGTLETAILEQLQFLFPDAFSMLEEFCRNHPTFDTALADQFAQELQFYLSYIRYMDRLRQQGHCFAYPGFTKEKTIRIESGYDLVLAQDGAVKPSAANFYREVEQSFLITGPNHGGKTTYACMVGQILYLASLGLPVPCRALEMYFLNGLYTHFAKNEDLSTNAGRLKEELQRVKSILDRLPGDSFVIFNDLFASTTTYDALQMGKRILERFMAQGCLCLFVTHIHDLAGACPGLVSLYASRDEGSGAYIVEIGEAGKRTYQNQWMDHYHLHREEIVERVRA